MLRPASARDRAILETLYSTGIRRKELSSLNVYDLDTTRGSLRIREGKGQKERIVPIGERALAWIEKYLTQVRPGYVVEPDDGTLFLTMDGGRFHGNVLTRMVHRYIQQADIGRKGSCHVFRHTVAGRLVAKGARLKEVADFLGHQCLDTTTIYAKLDLPALREVVLPWPEVLP